MKTRIGATGQGKATHSVPPKKAAPKGAKGKRVPGALKGKLRVGPEFFEKLLAGELARWE